MLSIGAAMFISQLGAIGKNRRDKSSRNKLPEFRSNYDNATQQHVR